MNKQNANAGSGDRAPESSAAGNKKLTVLKYLTSNRSWYSAAEVQAAVRLPEGSTSNYLNDLLDNGLIVSRPRGGTRTLEYHSLVQWALPEDGIPAVQGETAGRMG